MALSIFTMLYNHHHYLLPEYYHHPKQELWIHKTTAPHSSLPQPLVTSVLLSL